MIDNKEVELRPIHYLGSKLRILNTIKKVVDEIDPTKSKVVDLFAGSGTVSKFLSKEREVIAVDIQEYSRVLCSALLNTIKIDFSIENFLEKAYSSEHAKNLLYATQKIREYELELSENLVYENKKIICDLVENGAIIFLEKGFSELFSPKLINILLETIDKLEEIDYLKGNKAIITRYFGGTYFSYNQAVELDILLNEISLLKKDYRDTFIAAVLSTASDIVNTVGKQFAQPLKTLTSDREPKKNIENKILKDRSLSVQKYFKKWIEKYLNQTKEKTKNTVYKMDSREALDLVDSNVKVVYADPPYTRYHYSRYYHVLETIALHDIPEISKVLIKGKITLSKGIYRNDRHQSPFSIKTKSKKAFKDLFKKISQKRMALVLSYSPYDKTKKSTPRIHSVEELVDMAKLYFDNVNILSIGQFVHSKLNKIDNNFEKNEEAEILIICKMEN